MLQWARTVLVIERSLPPSTRLRGQATYSHTMADGRKALVLKKVFSVSQPWSLLGSLVFYWPFWTRRVLITLFVLLIIRAECLSFLFQLFVFIFMKERKLQSMVTQWMSSRLRYFYILIIPHPSPGHPKLSPSPLTPHLSPLTSHPTPLTPHLSSFTPHLSPLTTHPSPLTPHP